ncbi:MAG: cytochrome c biogenesis protein ResB [Corynebacterium sp.]|nr:cytochrome c biogenesis protein ResB [Corynebacterium sp.]
MKYLKSAWHWLTSMRTALALLFLLAIAAIPGAVLPQRNVSESQVDSYIAANGRTAEIYDKLQLFDVFSSSWFTAIYVLLFISLIGCILPRTWDHYHQLRTKPVRAPRNLERLPLSNSTRTVPGQFADEQAVLAKARGLLRGWKIAEYSPEQDRKGGFSLSAERGYLREFFNLVFHLGLVALLVTIGLGRMVYYEGQVIVVTNNANSQFCNTALANFDTVRGGALFDGTDLAPFCVDVKNFTADYNPNGSASMFTSDITYAVGDEIFSPEDTWKPYTLKVNHPLRIEGTRVYLQGHGFAPRVTVTWPNGESRTQMVQFAPMEMNTFLSTGAMRFDPPAGMYPDEYTRRQNQLAIQGLFAPTASFDGVITEDGQTTSTSSMRSVSPVLSNPGLAIDIYRGDNGLDTGRGQNLFSLDTSQMHSGALQKVERVNLLVGETTTLDDGTKITFDGAEDFVNLQVSRDPTQIWVLVSTVVMLVALMGSLLIKRRRIWVRVSSVSDTAYGAAGGSGDAASGSVWVIETAGLARTDRAGWGEEYDRFHRRLLDLPDPEEEE